MQGTFPKKFTTSRIVSIFKTGDKRLVINTSQKPILEKIGAAKLTNFLKINKLLNEYLYLQRGKTFTRSFTYNQLHIGNTINNINYCIEACINIKKAFSCLLIVSNLRNQKKGIKITPLNWCCYFSRRRQKVEVNSILLDSRCIDMSVYKEPC